MASNGYIRFLLQTIVSVSVYLFLEKFFPEKKGFSQKTADDGIRGGDSNLLTKAQKIAKAILKNRNMKVALITLFLTAGANAFVEEIQSLLVNQGIIELCAKNKELGDPQLKVICRIIEDNDLLDQSKAMRKLIAANDISNEHKIALLKIKFDSLINGEYVGKKRFILTILLGLILTFTISGIGGLSLLLEALRRLWEEGKISEILYRKLVKIALKTAGIPDSGNIIPDEIPL
jgi:hypothetical protein